MSQHTPSLPSYPHNKNKGALQCGICDKIFRAKTTLQNHVRGHAADEWFSCPICNKNFYTIKLLNRHKRAHDDSARLAEYQCVFCSREHASQKGLYSHLKEHIGEKLLHCCRLCSAEFDSAAQLATHERESGHTYEPLECKICGRLCKNSYELSGHVEIAHKKVKSKNHYECWECLKQFHSWTQLDNHLMIHTGGGGGHKCQICRKTLASSGGLKRHIATHKGEKRFGCDICNRKFSERRHLEKHMTTHTNERAFKCSICDKSYKVKYVLTNHIRTVHDKVKPHKCPNSNCGKAFGTKFQVVKHQQNCRPILPEWALY